MHNNKLIGSLVKIHSYGPTRGLNRFGIIIGLLSDSHGSNVTLWRDGALYRVHVFDVNATLLLYTNEMDILRKANDW